MFTLQVSGEPAPQGSKRHVGNGRMIESSKKVAPWRKAVLEAVQEQHPELEAFDSPVEVTAIFYLTRPKSVKRAVPSVPPDLDKLERGLFDALTIANVWTDDSLVVRAHSMKVYADVYPPGVAVIIDRYDEIPLAIG